MIHPNVEHVMLVNYFESGSILGDATLVRKCGNCDNCNRVEDKQLPETDLSMITCVAESVSHPVSITKLFEILAGKKTKYAKSFSHLQSYGLGKTKSKQY